MINILEIKNLKNKEVWAFRETFGSYYIFSDSIFSESEMYYSKIYTFNIENQELLAYPFNNKVHFISEGNSFDILYFATLQQNADGHSVEVSKLHLSGLTEEFIIDVTVNAKADLSSNLWNSNLIGIDERYCLLLLPNRNYSYDTNFYSEIVLIDSLEKKCYSATEGSFADLEILLKLSYCVVANNGKNILFKSGRIQPFEKREQWDQRYTFTEEKLIIVKTSDFIDCIVNRRELAPLLKRTYQGNEMVSVIANENEHILFYEENFEEDLTEIYSADLQNGQTSLVYQIKELFMSIVAYGDKLYGVREAGKQKIFYSFADKMTQAVVSDTVIYFDEQYRITCDSHNIGTYRIEIKDKTNGQIKKYTDIKFYYHFQKNTLLIYS